MEYSNDFYQEVCHPYLVTIGNHNSSVIFNCMAERFKLERWCRNTKVELEQLGGTSLQFELKQIIQKMCDESSYISTAVLYGMQIDYSKLESDFKEKKYDKIKENINKLINLSKLKMLDSKMFAFFEKSIIDGDDVLEHNLAYISDCLYSLYNFDLDLTDERKNEFNKSLSKIEKIIYSNHELKQMSVLEEYVNLPIKYLKLLRDETNYLKYEEMKNFYVSQLDNLEEEYLYGMPKFDYKQYERKSNNDKSNKSVAIDEDDVTECYVPRKTNPKEDRLDPSYG